MQVTSLMTALLCMLSCLSCKMLGKGNKKFKTKFLFHVTRQIINNRAIFTSQQYVKPQKEKKKFFANVKIMQVTKNSRTDYNIQ